VSGERTDTLGERALRYAGILGPVSALALAIGAGVIAGPPLGVLVLAASALGGAIATMWTSVRALVGETPLAPEDAFALGAPSSEEEQKRAVLRAIKDIEFERSVGKITDEDYRALLTRYRADAKKLLRQIDESRAPDRARAENLAAAYLAKGPQATTREQLEPPEESASEGSASEGSASEGSDAEASSNENKPAKKSKKKRGKTNDAATARETTTREQGRECKGCSVTNDADAAFCKGCGAKLTDAAEAS
jgi:hypothetical protein